MNIWTCNDFVGYWPVGTAAVVRAVSAEDAAHLLSKQLSHIGLGQDISANQMQPFTENTDVRILCDGNY